MKHHEPHHADRARRRARQGAPVHRGGRERRGAPPRLRHFEQSLTLLVAVAFAHAALSHAALAQVSIRSDALGFETVAASGWTIRFDAGDDDVTLAFRAPGGDGGVVLWSGPLLDGERSAFDANGLAGLLDFVFGGFAAEIGGARIAGTFDVALRHVEVRGLSFDARHTTGRLVVGVVGDVGYVWAANANPGAEATVGAAFEAMLAAADLRGSPADGARAAMRVFATLGHERLRFALPPGWTFVHTFHPFDPSIGTLEHPLGAIITITAADLRPDDATAYHALARADRAERLARETASTLPDAQVVLRPLASTRIDAVAVDVETADTVGAVIALLADGEAEGSTAIVTIRADAPRAAAAELSEALALVLDTFRALPGWWREPLPPPGG